MKLKKKRMQLKERFVCGKSLDELFEEALDRETYYSDFVYHSGNADRFLLHNNSVVLARGEENLSFSSHSMSQMCSKLGVPYQYIDKCLKFGEGSLATENLNRWLALYDRDMFIRLSDGDRIRGVLSTKYSVLDTKDVLSCLRGTGIASHDYSIQGYCMNDERLSIRFVKDEVIPSPDGEELYPAFTVDSSDVGRSCLSVYFTLFRKVCSNGLCFPVSDFCIYKQKHIGIREEEFAYAIRDLTDRVSSMAVSVSGLITRCGNANSPVLHFGGMDEDARRIRELKGGSALTKTESESVVGVLEKGIIGHVYKNNLWGVINSITEYAQTRELDRRLELENIAGRIMLSA